MKLDTLAPLAQTAHDTAETTESFVRNLHDGVELALAEQRAEREAELKSVDPNDRDTARKLDASVWADRRRAMRDEAEKQHGDRLAKMRERLLDQRAQLTEISELVGDTPSHLLTYLGSTGSDRSAALWPQVQHAGHATLRQLARKAIAERDIELASLIATRMSGLRPKDRPVAVEDLAEKLVGERHARQRAAVDLALDRVQDGLESVARWTTGRNPRGSGRTRIERGLRDHARAAQR